MLIVFTGNGKGKTTAALGQAARTIGRGKNVLMIQWIKGPWKSGEDFIHIKNKSEDNNGEFKLIKMGLGFVGILGDALPFQKHQESAEKAFKFFETELARNYWDTFILDEINVAMSLKLLSARQVLQSVRKAPINKYIILTGRGAPKSIIKAADLVTEMKEIKHPFNNGKLAKIAFDF